MIEMRIVNVVATANLKQRFHFEYLRKISGVSYDPEKYRGMVAYIKLPYMNGKVSLFSSGKMISIGTKKTERAINELEYVRNFLVSFLQS